MTLDPMLVEAAIQDPPPERRSVSEPGHVAETDTNLVDDPPSNVMPTSGNDDTVFLSNQRTKDLQPMFQTYSSIAIL